MECTVSEVLQFVEENDVKFIRLAFCDILGNQKNVSIMPDRLAGGFCRRGCLLTPQPYRAF